MWWHRQLNRGTLLPAIRLWRDYRQTAVTWLSGEPVEIPGPNAEIYQLYWQSNEQFIWYAGQPDNPDDYFNSAGDWALFRGSLSGETTQLWHYRGLYPSY